MKHIQLITYFVYCAFAAWLFLGDPAQVVFHGQEDGLAEYLTALCYFLAALVLIRAFVRSMGAPHTFLGFNLRQNVWLLLLAAFLLFCTGEELSWGQRIFGWSTPEEWSQINGHNETNLHNILDSMPPWLRSDAIMAAICSMYMIVLPFLTSVSAAFRRLVAWAGMPVPPGFVGVLMALTVVAFIVAYASIYSIDGAKASREYRELSYGFLFLATACALLAREAEHSRSDRLSVGSQQAA